MGFTTEVNYHTNNLLWHGCRHELELIHFISVASMNELKEFMNSLITYLHSFINGYVARSADIMVLMVMVLTLASSRTICKLGNIDIVFLL